MNQVNIRNPIVEEDLQHITSLLLPWHKLSGKTVLITGATGFIAGYLIESLLFLNEKKRYKPIKIVCLARNKKKFQTKYAFYKNRTDLDFLSQDVCDKVTYKKKIHYIIHAASYATPSKYGIDPVGTLLPNIIGTYNLLECSRVNAILGFLFISSGEIYGNFQIPKKDITENIFGFLNPLSLRSCYAESKRMGENMCISWSSQYHVPVTIVRLFHTYGPGMSLHDGRAHSDFIGDIVENKKIIIRSNGKSTRAFSYISDTIGGIFTVLLKGSNGEAYNIGGEKIISINQLAQLLVEIDSGEKIVIKKDMKIRGKEYLVSLLKKQYPINLQKIKALGWKPEYLPKDGLQRTVKSFLPA